MSLDSVMLVGGSGFLGLHLIQQFYEVNPRPQISVFDIRPLPEKISKYFTFDPAKIHCVVGDLSSKEDVTRAIKECHPTVIVHSASPIAGMAREIYEKVNIQGTRNLIACAKASHVNYLVYTSSAGVIFNGQDLHNADESWPIPEVPMDAYNETKALAEEMVLKANSPTENFYTVSLRPAGIFGPGDRQLVPGLRQVLKNGQTKFQVGNNDNLFDWTYVGNVADAHVLAAQKLLDPDSRDSVAGEKFFITNDAPTYFWNLARTVWKADGHVDNFNIVLNRPVAIIIGYLSEFFCGLIGKEPGLTPFRVKVVCAYRYHNISKARKILGYKPNVGIEQGIRYTLDWMDETSQ
ncbi:erg26, C-3 sterol dehydrogenase [Brettanomyces nanus]|uniref:Sterol-4-alpha-carboxylate 3-dehydrogenase ERG26, decarboxylating n=1 Tax=Eeniella nana TaxID=13502 RepID=A0A875RX14_EENNA|nr:erg26, C-3 sterol dehydrogenase [Brettanomyces nanus]QPG73526.1 erg26, C-3 sterol dehydrogenase [Brettanomyces nanus]